MIKVIFEGIDRMNRPIFRNIKGRSRYGSVDILFPHWTTEKEVLEKVSAEDLCFFGNSFDCEPMGDDPAFPLEIIMEE